MMKTKANNPTRSLCAFLGLAATLSTGFGQTIYDVDDWYTTNGRYPRRRQW